MATFREKLRAKLPARKEIFPVFSVIVFIVYTWAFYVMVHKVPSWLYYMSVGNVLIITAYVLTFALIESIIILGLMLLFSLVLPEKRYKDHFIAQSSVLITLMGFGAYMLQRNVNFIYDLQFHELGIFALVILASILILILVLSFVFDRFKKVTRLVNAFAEWMSIFGYIYVPLSLLGLVIVIFRNVF